MNVTDIQEKIQGTLTRGSIKIQQHSPEILLAAGLVGMVATVFMASKATLKVESVLSKHDIQLEKLDSAREQFPEQYSEEDASKDKAIVYVQTGLEFAKLYAPAVSIGFLSVAAILASHGIMKDRQVALIAAYNLIKEGYSNYRARVVEDYGEDVDHNFHLGLRDDTKTTTEIDEEGNKKKIKATVKTLYRKPSPYSRIFDEYNPMFRKERKLNRLFIEGQQRFANQYLQVNGVLFLNQVYEMLGFPFSKEGQVVGWILKSPEEMNAEGRAGYVDFGLQDLENEPDHEFIDGTNPTVLLDFNVDGIILDEI